MKPLFIACDFDGTITRRDTLHVIVEAFGTAGVWQTLEPRLRAGEITIEQAMEEQFRGVRADEDQIRKLVVSDASVRAGFPEFVAWAGREGHRLLVLSNGFRWVIDVVLAEAGLEGLEVVSHDARFSSGGCELVWAERGERCAVCGRRCKRHDLGLRRRGERLVYIGDGISDRCVSQTADMVFARDGLAEYLAAEGVPFVPFEDFHEVRRALEPLATAA